MFWRVWVGRFLVAGLGVVFLVSLAAILLTGPVIVRGAQTTLDVARLGVSSARLRADVERLCGELAPRHERSMERLGATADWIASELRAAGLPVELQEYDAGPHRFTNVIARREGTDAQAGVLVVGAHYDSYNGTIGADDNASGVAVLLELVRTLPAEDPRRTHMFVAFASEEPPYFGTELMGSHVLARRLDADGTKVDLMISLDMVGYYTDAPNSQRFPLPGLGLLYPTTGDFIAIIGDAAMGSAIGRVKRGMMATGSLPVRSFRGLRGWAAVDLSDHWAFRELGFRAVHVTDTSFMRFPHYHTDDDTPEKLDYERMAQLVEALHGVLWEGRGR